MRLGRAVGVQTRGRVRHACGSALWCLPPLLPLCGAALPSLRPSAGGGEALRRQQSAAHRAMRRHHACAAALALCLTYTDAVDCVAAGFAPSLRCGSCATLEALVPDEDIVKDCRSCCADDDKVTYVKARLEVCE